MEVTKPGYLTTEFWIAILAQLVPLLVFFGILTPDEADTLSEAIVQAAIAIGALVAAVVPLIEYIKSRTAVKEAQAFAYVASRAEAVSFEVSENN